MKKHAGHAFFWGLLISVFGLLLMGAVNIVTATFFKSSEGSFSNILSNFIKTTSDISFWSIVFGIVIIIFGIFMWTRKE
ncbi:MAG: hypothetical protein ABID61_02030 [Candidatus Micrarchaeota archaeon]